MGTVLLRLGDSLDDEVILSTVSSSFCVSCSSSLPVSEVCKRSCSNSSNFPRRIIRIVGSNRYKSSIAQSSSAFPLASSSSISA